MDYYLLTDLAARVGYHLALSGAETFRVEETIRRIIGAYGIECEAFSIPNCVMVSLEAANGKPLMVMKRVDFHGNDFARNGCPQDNRNRSEQSARRRRIGCYNRDRLFLLGAFGNGARHGLGKSLIGIIPGHTFNAEARNAARKPRGAENERFGGSARAQCHARHCRGRHFVGDNCPYAAHYSTPSAFKAATSCSTAASGFVPSKMRAGALSGACVP